jgi:hypothetical protein
MITKENIEQNNELVGDVVLELMKLGEPVKESPCHYNNGKLREDIGVIWPDGKRIQITNGDYTNHWRADKGKINISGYPCQPEERTKLRWVGGNNSMHDYDPGTKVWEHEPLHWSSILGYNEKDWRCEINLSAKKNPAQIAKEITGRFMRKYMEMWPRSVERAENIDNSHREYMSKRKLLEDRLAVKWGRHSETSFTVEGIKYPEFSLHFSGNVDIKLRSISCENAVKVIEYMKQIAGKDGEL